VTGGALTITVAVLAMAGILFLLPQYLQDIAGDSTVAIGVQLLPFGVTFMLFALVSGRVAAALGPRLVITGGLLIATLGIGVLAFVPELPDLAAVLVGTTLFGTGAAFAVPPATTAVINALPTAQAGDGSAVNQVTRQVGAAFGVAVVGSILASVYLRGIDPALEGLTPTQVADATSSFAGSEQVAAASKSEALARAAETAFTDGYRAGMLTAAILVLLATGAVWVALRDRSADV